MRTCPFNNCTKTIPDQIFACKPHWFSLDWEERSTIHDAYNAYMADKIGMEELREIQQKVLGERGTA